MSSLAKTLHQHRLLFEISHKKSESRQFLFFLFSLSFFCFFLFVLANFRRTHSLKIDSFDSSSESSEDFFNSVEATEFNLRIRELPVQPINPHHLCPQSLEYILHRIPNITTKMATVNKDFVESFDGTRTERFFRLLHDAFDESGVEWTPAQFVKAIDRKSKGAALDVLERDARCCQPMKDATRPALSVPALDFAQASIFCRNS